MNWSHHAREAEFARRAVSSAAKLCRVVRQGTIHAEQRKPDSSPVTEADYVSQALIGGWLAEAFPDDALVAEEDSRVLEADPAMQARVVARLRRIRPEAEASRLREWLDHGSGRIGKRLWALDPIDGTKGFVRGGQYVVALALIEEGRVMVAALAAPALAESLRPAPSESGSVVVAVRGEGAWVMPLEGGTARRLAVSTCREPSRARMVCSFEDDHTDRRAIALLRERLGMAEPIRMDSQAKYLVVAGGEAELLVRLLPERLPSYREKVWDVAAGLLVVEEAGGRVTDLRGGPLDLTTGRELTRNHGSLVSNGSLHEPVLTAILAVLSEART